MTLLYFVAEKENISSYFIKNEKIELFCLESHNYIFNAKYFRKK
jgi:hypothetical protein